MNDLHINKPTATIAQISDLHLRDAESQTRFIQVLNLALSHRPDLLLLTGDLVNDGRADGYDWLFSTLKATGVPYLCLAGNHDVTAEIGHDLPFDERQFLPINMDHRLPEQTRLLLHLPDLTWQILAVNSSVSGQIYGHLSDDCLQFLHTHLQSSLPTLIAMHHHTHPVGSAWIDAHILDNHDEFWRTVAPFKNLHAVVCGHVHQEQVIDIQGKKLLTCPATSRQFLPHHDEFAIDDIAVGFRLIHICNKKTLATFVKRVEN